MSRTSQDRRVTLRIPPTTAETIDGLLKQRNRARKKVPRMSLNDWLVEAIERYIAGEKSLGMELQEARKEIARRDERIAGLEEQAKSSAGDLAYALKEVARLKALPPAPMEPVELWLQSAPAVPRKPPTRAEEIAASIPGVRVGIPIPEDDDKW